MRIYLMFLFFISSIHAISADQNIEFIEHSIYVGDSGGTPSNYPGVVFKIHSNGDSFMKKGSEFQKYKLGANNVKKIMNCANKININDFENMGPGIDDSRNFFVSRDGSPVPYSHHGASVVIRIKFEAHEIVIISPFYPKGNKMRKLIEKVNSIIKTKRPINSIPDIESDPNIFPMVLKVYFSYKSP